MGSSMDQSFKKMVVIEEGVSPSIRMTLKWPLKTEALDPLEAIRQNSQAGRREKRP
jgi:hypothetical protein